MELFNLLATELFDPPETLLRVKVRVDDQVLEFRWNSDSVYWEAMDVNSSLLQMEAGMIADLVSYPSSSRWGSIY